MSDLLICRCEEITEDIIRKAVRDGCKTADAVKRYTRAGMGMCQSKTCYNLIARIIREETGLDPNDIPPFTQQAPVRPVSACVLYNDTYDEKELFEE